MEPYNSTPMAPGAQPSRTAAPMNQKARDRSTAPLTEEDLANYRSRGRKQAFFVILGGFALLAFNHFTALHDHQIWLKAIYGGAVFIVLGFLALFQPLIMFRHLPVGKQLPSSLIVLMFLAMAIGVVIGWQIHMYYNEGRF
jgi:hypothetical protein